MSYSLSFPGKIIFGAGERRKLAELLPAGPVLFVAGRHSASRIQSEIVPALGGRSFELIADISPEPPLADVERALAAARRIGAASVVGWGGGSAMDTAKSVAALLPLSGPVADYFYNRREIPGHGLFLAEVPTTAGTGAEITPNAVLLDPETGIKQSLRGTGLYADLALVDPELTYDCPPAVTAASGFDALTQAIESFISRKANPVSKTLAMQAAKNILSSLHPAWSGEIQARNFVAEGSMMAAMAFSSSGLGAVHGIGHPLGSILHVPHGVCCAVLLPTILKWNLEAAHDDLEDLALALTQDPDPANLIELITELRSWLELPADFKAYGLAPEHYDFIVRNSRSGSMKCNPRDLSDDDVRRILEELS